MSIAVYTLTSDLHDQSGVDDDMKNLFDSIDVDFTFRGSDYSDYGTHTLDLIFVRTGGTEGTFLKLLPSLSTLKPFLLLTSGKSNSLAASMEILSFLQLKGLKGEIIHGNGKQMEARIKSLTKVREALFQLGKSRLGVIGKPSDWLIASHTQAAVVKDKMGMELIDIPIEELLAAIPAAKPSVGGETTSALLGALAIYEGLKTLVRRYRLDGFTLRCFDLLTAVRNTGCLALAKLNAEGIVAGCEGDVPAMITMRICQLLTGSSGFQANPARIDTERGEIIFAHCTIPFNMLERFEYDTHFESGIGIAIRGYVEEGPVTVCKVSPNLNRWFVEEGELLSCLGEPGLCRTQMLLRLPCTSYFLKNPIGNHHIIVKGRHKEVFEELIDNLSS